MKKIAYPFLFAKNIYIEHRDVLLPDFIDNNTLLAHLGSTTQGYETAENEAFFLARDFNEYGPIDLIFISRDAIEKDVLESGDQTLRDEHGRRILYVEGFILRSRGNLLEISEADINNLREILHPTMKEFWRAKNWGKEKSRSTTSFELTQKIANNKPIKLIPIDEYSSSILNKKTPQSKAALFFYLGVLLILSSTALPSRISKVPIALGTLCIAVGLHLITQSRKN